ncbi:MAG: hypothetical protein SPI94_04725 [Candidatus Onthovivens sp.]|nr:hypothetical protein [Candidatus Onthovivens sp.]
MNSEKILNVLNKLEVKEESKTDLENLKRELQADILTNGKIKSGILSTFKKYVKQNQKDGRLAFEHIFKSKNGNYVFANGYFLLDWGNNKDNIPAELKAYVKDEETDKNFDFETFEDKITDKETKINVKEIEKIVKYNKFRCKEVGFYQGEQSLLADINNEVYFNPKYLLDIIKITNSKEEKINVKYRTNISPICFKINNVKCILLPVNLTTDSYIKQQREEKENFEKLQKVED